MSRAGSIDWCCFPRFDAPAVFARLLDWERGGYFALAPADARSVRRRYVPATNVVETTFETDAGAAVLFDFMPVHAQSRPEEPRAVDAPQQIVRLLRCTRGTVRARMRCEPRFEYGSILPHAALDGARAGIVHGGAHALSVYCSADMQVVDAGFEADVALHADDELAVAVTYTSPFHHDPADVDPAELHERLRTTVQFWEQWSAMCTYEGPYREQVLRSALTLKALTCAPAGALVAAPTTSLPEALGGPRNWDYRYTWIRDATFAVQALSAVGYIEEGHSFERWIEWSTAGRAVDVQALYGVAGERRLTEVELTHLEGYRRSRPVRVGNDAYRQYQSDVYGYLLDSAYLNHKFVHAELPADYWDFLREIVQWVVDHWREPDEGIWEFRSERRHFVYSKVWCWVALDRALRVGRAHELPGDYELWERTRAEIRDDVLMYGVSAERGTFVQEYGGEQLDAALLMLPLVGFIRASDPRMRATIEAVERELGTADGLVYRYLHTDDGLPPGEAPFAMCSFWLVSNLILLGEHERARRIFDRVVRCANDLGLLSEEITPEGELLGNFPQAFSHMGLINAAVRLEAAARRGARQSR